MQTPPIINQQTADKLNETIAYLCDAVKGTGDTIAQEAPKIATEIVQWKAADAIGDIVWIVLVGAIVMSAWAIALMAVKRLPKEDREEPGIATVSLLALSFAVVIFWVGGAVALNGKVSTVIKCHYAPRVVVLDYLRSAIGK